MSDQYDAAAIMGGLYGDGIIGLKAAFTPALADNMGGVFSCTVLTDVEGAVTVDARGTFTASG